MDAIAAEPIIAEALDSKSDIENKVLEQYDTDSSMAFYEYIMGGGGDDIHYGVFIRGDEDLKESSENSIKLLAKLIEDARASSKVHAWAPNPAPAQLRPGEAPTAAHACLLALSGRHSCNVAAVFAWHTVCPPPHARSGWNWNGWRQTGWCSVVSACGVPT